MHLVKIVKFCFQNKNPVIRTETDNSVIVNMIEAMIEGSINEIETISWLMALHEGHMP